MNRRSEHLLIVEDDVDFVFLLREMFRRYKPSQYTFDNVLNLSRAQEIFEEGRFDLVLLDLSLPDSSGLETLDQMVALATNCPILVLTGKDDEEISLEAVRRGAQDYLNKSDLSPKLLFRAIAHAKQRKTLLHEIEKTKNRFRRTFEMAGVGILQLSRDFTILDVNRKVCELVQLEAVDLIHEKLSSLIGEQTFSVLQQELESAEEKDIDDVRLEVQLHHPNGTEFWALLMISLSDDTHHDEEITLVMEDITERKESEEKLRHFALYDSLTKLPNRAMLMQTLKNAIARHHRHDNYLFSVLFLDLDRFKNVNDSLGHTAGDELLVALGERLVKTLRENDLVARLGGDEFAVVLDSIQSKEDVHNIAQRLLSEIEQPFTLMGREVFISASIGITHCDGDYHEPGDLLRDADAAMYRSKEGGRGRSTLFQKHMHLDVLSRFSLESELRMGIQRGELRAHYQPIVSLTTGQLIGFETLVRWEHPERGMVSPGKFIPVAEESELIVQLDRWVLHEALRQSTLWLKFCKNRDFYISVNLSSRHFMMPDVVTFIGKALDDAGVKPEHLKIEVTESVLISDVTRARTVLAELRGMGVQVFMDDFGTGYSSLSYLQKFPIDALKIDRSFVQQMENYRQQADIVELILLLAKKLGVKVIAEGIEKREHLSILKELGCDAGQGYFLSRPQPPLELEGGLAKKMEEWLEISGG